MLQVEQVSAGYRRVPVLRAVDLRVEEGEIVAVLGANGAGKTTLMKTIAGLVKPSAGRISWQGRSIERLAPHRICALGIALVPEGRGIFVHQTVRENLLLAGARRLKQPEFADDLAEVFALFPILEERQGAYGGELSGGQQQMLAISRAVLQRPKLILLDEPSLGLSPLLTAQVLSLLPRIADKLGTSVLVVEQNAPLALTIASRAYVLQNGSVTYDGGAEELKSSTVLLESYLGGPGAP